MGRQQVFATSCRSRRGQALTAVLAAVLTVPFMVGGSTASAVKPPHPTRPDSSTTSTSTSSSSTTTSTSSSTTTSTSSSTTTSTSTTTTTTVPSAISTTVVIPSNGATVSGTTTLDAAHTGSVVRVEFRLSGNGYPNVLLGTAANTVYGWIYSWNTLNTPNATYTLRSRAFDNSGHSAYSAPITINVANSRPTYIAPPWTPVAATFGDSIFVNAQDYLTWYYAERDYSTEHHEWGGTAPCDYFDQLATFYMPTVAVLSWVGNMLTACTQGDRGTQYQVYSQDIDHAAAILAFRGIPTIWMGGPGPGG